MKRAVEKCKPRKSRAVSGSQFVPAVVQRWQYGSGSMSSIVVTVDQVVNGLLKIEERLPEWRTPLAVAQVLLLRLEAMREEIHSRAEMLHMALNAEDYRRASLEVTAIKQLICTERSQERPGRSAHGIKVTTDREFHGIEEVRA
jgi:hypothetical protein